MDRHLGLHIFSPASGRVTVTTEGMVGERRPWSHQVRSLPMLTTLRSIASLPRHLVDGMQAAVETTHQLPSLRRVVTARLGSLDQGLRDLLALLPAVASDLERVRATVEPQHQRVAAIEAAIVVLPGIAADLER